MTQKIIVMRHAYEGCLGQTRNEAAIVRETNRIGQEVSEIYPNISQELRDYNIIEIVSSLVDRAIVTASKLEELVKDEGKQTTKNERSALNNHGNSIYEIIEEYRQRKDIDAVVMVTHESEMLALGHSKPKNLDYVVL